MLLLGGPGGPFEDQTARLASAATIVPEKMRSEFLEPARVANWRHVVDILATVRDRTVQCRSQAAVDS